MDKESGSDFETSQVYKPKKANFSHTARRLRKDRKTSINLNFSEEWQETVADICGGPGQAPETSLHELKQILLTSKTAEALFAAVGDVSLQYDSQTPVSQMYITGDKVVLAFNPLHSKGALLYLLKREIRRVHQHRIGALVDPMSFEPEEAVLVNRAQQGDALAAAIKMAWEMKLAGESDAWDFVSTAAADEAHAFEAVAQKDFRTLSNGDAMRAAYDKFFAAGTKTHDKRVIQHMLLSEKYIKGGGKKRQVAGYELFRLLGEMPLSRNYLVIPGKTPPTDARYKTVEDRSNANFLWFIKFECSFQEKEAKMVEKSVIGSAETVRSAEIVDFSVWMLKSGRALAPKPTT